MSEKFKRQFPEATYPCYNPEYNKKVITGYEIAEKSSVIICGLARDLGDTFFYTKARINYLSSLFAKSTTCFIENDSTDGTDINIKEWADISECLTLFKPRHKQVKTRARRLDMSFYRNMYLDKIKNLDSDYVIILDTDLLGGWSYDGIMNSISYNYDVVGSNSFYYKNNKRLYFDSWAFRHKDVKNPNELFVNRGQEPFEVESCFGGLAIYKKECLKEVDYDASGCDHVTLHRKIIRNGFKIWLNPSQITLYNRHQYVL